MIKDIAKASAIIMLERIKQQLYDGDLDDGDIAYEHAQEMASSLNEVIEYLQR